MENLFVIHSWKRGDTLHAQYTVEELKKIHRTIGHPSVRATEGFFNKPYEKGCNNMLEVSLMRSRQTVISAIHRDKIQGASI